jgi:DNA mismatch repair ATPase MutL
MRLKEQDLCDLLDAVSYRVNQLIGKYKHQEEFVRQQKIRNRILDEMERRGMLEDEDDTEDEASSFIIEQLEQLLDIGASQNGKL